MLLSRRRRAGIAATALAALIAVSSCGGGSERSRSSTYSFVSRDRVQVSGRGGALSLTLTAPALWFNDSQGVLAFKPVSGDFKVTATVRTQRASNDEPPPPAIRLGGLMARDPASDSTGMQNYVHIVVGNVRRPPGRRRHLLTEHASGSARALGRTEVRIRHRRR